MVMPRQGGVDNDALFTVKWTGARSTRQPRIDPRVARDGWFAGVDAITEKVALDLRKP
jgi:hypothetical protein